MRVRYTLRAQRDLEAIYLHIEKQSAQGSRTVKRTIERRIANLANFSLLAPETEERGAYELSITKYPYKAYYRVENGEVWIMHIRHTARRSKKGKRD